MQKKIFILAGELSGDKLAAWYVNKLKEQAGSSIYFSGIGGDFLAKVGVKLYERFEKLNVAGIVEIVKHLRFLLSFLNQVTYYIINEKFDEVIVVDFPGFNLRLIKKLKKLCPNIKITYLSPPQLWIWGAWRIKKIKEYCDKVIVIYPFEVEWYKNRGVNALWLEYPFHEKLMSYANTEKTCNVAILPGSRLDEIERLLPLFLNVMCRFKLAHQDIKIILPLAESIDKSIVERMLQPTCDVFIVQNEEEKFKALSSCCLALSKPGTVTLELGLLGVPTIVAYKTSWATYYIARMLVNIKYMSLANLLLGELVYPECIQSDCTEEKILKEVEKMYVALNEKKAAYEILNAKLRTLQKMLS